MTSESGGVTAVNAHIYRELKCHFELLYGGPISVPRSRLPALFSRFRRHVLHLPGAYDFYSRKRLAALAGRAFRQIPKDANAVFFKECTPWIECTLPIPYFAYTDVCFHTYFHNTFDPSAFRQADRKRLFDTEAAWLSKAAAVFFRSTWGADMTRQAYDLPDANLVAVGRGGGVAIPACDIYKPGTFRLLTIANHFRQKGGDILAEAYQHLCRQHTAPGWDIVGGPPDSSVLALPNVQYHGYLHKEHPGELALLEKLLSQAFVLVHPTREDTNPLVITEAAYHGCPAISVDRFAIPEMITDGRTGLLIPFPAEPRTLKAALQSLLSDPQRYRAMRKECRRRAIATSSWQAVADRMAETMVRCLT